MMRVSAISDIHGDLNIKVPRCEVLCICGDIVGLNDQRSMDASEHWFKNRFVEWINSLPCEFVLIVPGNHDFYLEDLYKKEELNTFNIELAKLTNNKAIVLVDSIIDINGITFYGCPWINPIPFQEGRWAFVEDSKNIHYQSILDCDVLLTHDNPFNNEDLEYCSFGKSKVHFFGHWHDGVDNVEQNKFNVSYLNDMYNIKKKYKAPVVNIEKITEVTVVEDEEDDN